MPSKEVYRGICTMMRRKNGATAIEIQYKFKLTYAQTIDYLMQAKADFSVVKNGTKLMIKKDGK